MRIADVLTSMEKANGVLEDTRSARDGTRKAREIISRRTPRQRVADLFAEIGLGAFEPEVIVEAYVRDFIGVGRKPSPEHLRVAMRFEDVLLLATCGIDELRQESDLTEEQCQELVSLEPIVLSTMISKAERRLRAISEAPARIGRPSSSSICIAEGRSRARNREAGPSAGRTRGSRRVTVGSRAGPDDPGDPEPAGAHSLDRLALTTGSRSWWRFPPSLTPRIPIGGAER